MSRYTAKDGHQASKAERVLLDYIARRWGEQYQLRGAVDGTGYHLCTPFACCQFSDLDGLKQFLGEPQWQN
jgi:hypothetical protein